MSYRKVIRTDNNSQEVSMTLPPGNTWGLQKHEFSQQINVISGNGIIVFDKTMMPLNQGQTIVIPPFVNHDVRNISNEDPLILDIIYMPARYHPRLHQINRP